MVYFSQNITMISDVTKIRIITWKILAGYIGLFIE